jgi:hypothetical protein
MKLYASLNYSMQIAKPKRFLFAVASAPVAQGVELFAIPLGALEAIRSIEKILEHHKKNCIGGTCTCTGEYAACVSTPLGVYLRDYKVEVLDLHKYQLVGELETLVEYRGE